YPLLDDVRLVLDELVVNTLRHTRSGAPGGRFAVKVRRDVAGVTVWVADEGGPSEPRVRDLTPESTFAESGRGLFTVDALAAHWSWQGDARGRTVRATFATCT
ncbi:MAG: ATP-binding protein, partial [Stackebrandtia sp.]